MSRAIVLAVLLASASAAAQDAREEFTRGTADAEEQRYADALEHFRRAYELSHNPVALYDEGTTLRALGRYVEARATFERFLRDHPDAPADLRDSVTTMLDDVELRIAHVTILVPDLPHLELRLDGEVRAPQEEPYELDPGRHVAQASVPLSLPYAVPFELAPGERRSVDLAFDPEPRPTGSGDALIWGPIAGSAAAIVIALAIAIGVAVNDASQLEPRTAVVLRP